MQATKASKTAGWVAAGRSFGRYLPEHARLCSDPYGVRFAEPWLQQLERSFDAHPALAQRLLLRIPPAARMVLYMQLRTRFIDDAVRGFAQRGGAQVVLLGAGYDSRAVRLGQDLPSLTFYEVDHPATQAMKRERLPELGETASRCVSWDFQHDAMSELPAALAATGHVSSRPTLTIWEGVTMYLELAALEATLASVAAYSAPSSPLVFTYFDRRRFLQRPSLRARAMSLLVASVGEPFRFGFVPEQLEPWLAERSFTLQRNVAATELARQLLPAEQHYFAPSDGRHFAIAERSTQR